MIVPMNVWSFPDDFCSPEPMGARFCSQVQQKLATAAIQAREPSGAC
jgi:hypothetical protein